MVKQESDNTKIALINNNVAYIQKDISEIKTGIKELGGVYETKEEAVGRGKVFDDRLTILERASGAARWSSPIISSALTAVIVFLLMFYLQHK